MVARIPQRGLALVLGALALGYLVVLLAQAADIITANDWNPDTVIPWVLTSSPGGGGARDVIDGSYGFWSVLWFNGLTQDLPLHRALWVAQPIVLWLATAALIAFAVGRVAGRAAAALAAVLVLCVSSEVLVVFLRPTMHGQTVFAAAVLAAFAVELTRVRPFGGGGRRLAIAVVVVALVTGVQLADPQLWISGVVPLVVAVLLWWLLARDAASRRALGIVAATVVASVAVRLVAGWIMSAAGYHELAPDSFSPIHSLSDIGPRAHRLLDMVLWLGNGTIDLSTAGIARGLLGLACAAAILAGVALAPLLLIAGLRRRVDDPARLVHVTFWSVVVVGFVGALLLTNLADQPSVRYILPMLLAAAATAPLLLRIAPLTAMAALAGSAVIVGGSLLALADRDVAGVAPGARAMTAAIQAAARNTGATTGFGPYDLASNVTWATHGRVVSRPIVEYRTPVCPFPVAIDRRWYRPTRAKRTFVLWRGTTPPPGLGTPVQSVPLPDATMFVYDGDVASRLCR
jgi:hypothetical protein